MKTNTIDKQILSIALSLVALLVVPILINPKQGTEFLKIILDFITGRFGPLYLWACLGIFGFLIWLAFSKYGKIKLGSGNPDFSTFSWLALIFTAGIGSGIMYWGIIEWAFYYTSPPFDMDPKVLAQQVLHPHTACSIGDFRLGQFIVFRRFRLHMQST